MPYMYYCDMYGVLSAVLCSPDGTYALAGSSDGTLFIWNIAKNKVEKTLKEHRYAVLVGVKH